MQKNKTNPPVPVKSRRNLYISLFAVMIALLAIARSEFFYVLSEDNGVYSAAMHPLKEENWDHPVLQKLSFDERLVRTSAGGSNDFEKSNLLMQWAHDQWRGGDSHFYYSAWDASEILRLARKQGNKAFCAQYAIVFLQACLSVGITARYVDLPSHFTVEIWSNNYNQWVMMDPTSNHYFERNERPLHGIDLCAAYWKDDFVGIEKVSPNGSRSPVTKEDLSAYWTYSIVTRNDHLSHPATLIVNGVKKNLVLEKDHTKYPYVGKDQITYVDDIIAWKQDGQTKFQEGKKYSEDREDFLVPMNQTLINVVARHANKGQIKLKFVPHNASSFKSFYSMRDDSHIWRDTEPSVTWNLHPGVNKFSCRVKTNFARLGHISSVSVYYKPNWFRSDKKQN